MTAAARRAALPLESCLKRSDFIVSAIPLRLAQEVTRQYHYAHGGANTATYAHGLFRRGAELQCLGIAWWIPPTKSSALKTYPLHWQGVLSLSRLVILPDVPKNAATFLLARSVRLIDRAKWPCLVTYADEWQGHTGAIYRAANWRYLGLTQPEATFVRRGQMIARKAGPKTRTRAEMEALGAEFIGRFAKHKFVLIRGAL